MSLLARIRAALAHPRFPIAMAAVAVLLALPSVGTGFVVDDFGLRAISLGLADDTIAPGSRFDQFSFIGGAPGERLHGIDSGWGPWFTSESLRLRFFRPLSSFTHWLDFQLWPSSPAAMHLVNLAIAAGVVLAAGALYRRTLGATWIAGLATAFYAVAPGHAIAAGWIAGRNGVLAPLFGVLAVVVHDRARRDAWSPGIPLSAALFALSLLSGEAGVATGAYLLAHAIYLDPSPSWAGRLRALAPHAVVGVAWIAAYKLLGYGARGSVMYIDPASEPLEYLRAAAVRAPILLNGAWSAPAATLFVLISRDAAVALAVYGAISCAFIAWVLLPLLRADSTARFFGAGTLLALVPISAVAPSDRVLYFVGLGAFALMAKLIAAAPASGPRRWLAYYLVFLHGVYAIPLYAIDSVSLTWFASLSRDPLDAVLLEPEVARQTVIFVNAPVHFFTSHLAAMRQGTSKPVPLRWRCLASGLYPVTVKRLDARTLTVRTEGGLIQDPGTRNVEGEEISPLVHWSYLGQHLTQFVRPRGEAMRVGETLALTGVTLEVREVTRDGRPVEVRFTFDAPLESPDLRWLAWSEGRYVDFALPAAGASVKLAAQSLAPR